MVKILKRKRLKKAGKKSESGKSQRPLGAGFGESPGGFGSSMG